MVESLDMTWLQAYLTVDVAVFLAVQFVNVVISTVKSVLLVNGSPMSASVWNTVSYTISAVITKMITQQPFEVVIAASIVTNMVGTYIGKVILVKMRKEQLWTINATIRNHSREYVEGELLRRGVQYTLLPGVNDRMLLCAYSYSKAESAIVKDILAHEDVRYNVMESIGGTVM